MQVDVAFKNVSAGDNIKEFINEKTEKLKKYFDGRIHAKWVISNEKDDYITHLHVMGNHIDYYGEARVDNLLSSIEASVEKVEKQLKKHKEILKDHHK